LTERADAARDVTAPENLSLLLPPRSPRNHPTERIILQLKENRFANRAFDGLAARVDGSGP